MVVLKVISYYDVWSKDYNKAVFLEKGGELYNASGLFSKLKDFEIRGMEDVKVLYEEELDYNDKDAKEQKAFLEEIIRLEKMCGIKPFGGIGTKSYWVYVNGVSNIKAYA